MQRIRNVVFVTLGAGALLLAGLGIAAAQTGGPDTAAPERSERAQAKDREHPGGMGRKGHRGMPGPGIRGEFVVRDREGAFRTVATQMGEATAVSADAITVRSEDGFSRTYRIDDATSINGNRGEVGDLATGTQVRVLAHLDGDTATAVHIVDVSRAREMRDRAAERRGGPRSM